MPEAKGGTLGWAFNVHNQNTIRARYQGSGRGSGFYVEFLRDKAAIKLEHDLDDGAFQIIDASLAALITTTDDAKQKIRTYLDGVFLGSAMHGNMHRRVSNAGAQSIYYNDFEAKGQFTGLIYSKWGRGRGPANFVDFLLLHVRGGTVRPRDGGWLRIPGLGVPRSAPGQAGAYPISGSRIFFARSKRPFENVLKGWSRCDSSLGCGPERAVAEWQDLRSDRSVIRPT